MINSIEDFGKSVPRNIRKKLRYFDIFGSSESVRIGAGRIGSIFLFIIVKIEYRIWKILILWNGARRL